MARLEGSMSHIRASDGPRHGASRSGNAPAGPTSPLTSGLPLVALVVVGIACLQALMLVLFSWPNARLAPRDLPIAVAGPPQAVERFERELERSRPGAFTLHRVADAQAARERVRNRDDYGAVILGPDGPFVLTASAASTPVAQLLPQVGAAANEGRPVPVNDVVAAPSGDPRGTGLGTGMLPLILTPMACGIVLSLVVRRLRWRVMGAAAFSIVGGLASTGLLQGWVGALDGPYLTNAGVAGLMMLAISWTVVGLTSVFGKAGIGVGALLMFLVGNPLSGITSAPEMLPQPWGTLGQYLPPGAAGNLLRSTAFFDGNGAGGHLAVLLTWILGAALLVLTKWLLERRRRAAQA
ncbi:ABC transporter permease [Streptomyces sp. NPDC057702]|uniref:ABC transporter permease n=1 Tax=unclassified Streptomyces TaxID=2593676 RepID=UPI0036BA1560